MKRFVLPFLLVLAGCSQQSQELDVPDGILHRACAYLWSMQEADGAWRSQVHGLMKGGEATTAFVLYALASAPDDVCSGEAGALDHGLSFIRSHISGEGIIGLSDPDILDYPNYTTGFALRLLAEHGSAADSSFIGAMRSYLVDQQFDEDRGIARSSAAYGGWGFGERGLRAGSFGHVDLSHTRRVLQALRSAGHHDAATLDKVQWFLKLHQKDLDDKRLPALQADLTASDGGFFGSASVSTVNKSPLIATANGVSVHESYATATADGLLALLASGLTINDESVQRAQRWLANRPDLSYPAGIPHNDPSEWGRVMFYYHIMVRAETNRALRDTGPWREKIGKLIRDRQNPAGSFRNPYGGPNKEDDPLLATAMVIIALS